MSGKKVLWQSVSAVRQRVIRAKTVKRGAELHREETERGVRSSGSLVSSLSTLSTGSQCRATGGREKPTDSGTMVARERWHVMYYHCVNA